MDVSIKISKEATIQDYLNWIGEKDRMKLGDFIYKRFYERYFKPFEYPSHDYKREYKHGFAMMGSASLMIETYMAYKRGIKDTKGKGRQLFCEFFNSEKGFEVFKDTRRNKKGHYLQDGLPSKFYYYVRCGILHQGETNGGWTITRKKELPLFDESTCKINAFKFCGELKNTLVRYKKNLEESGWDSEIHQNFRQKMDYVIENCQKK